MLSNTTDTVNCSERRSDLRRGRAGEHRRRSLRRRRRPKSAKGHLLGRSGIDGAAMFLVLQGLAGDALHALRRRHGRQIGRRVPEHHPAQVTIIIMINS